MMILIAFVLVLASAITLETRKIKGLQTLHQQGYSQFDMVLLSISETLIAVLFSALILLLGAIIKNLNSTHLLMYLSLISMTFVISSSLLILVIPVKNQKVNSHEVR